MSVRNCREIGENLQKIITRLMANDELVKLLYYTDKDPLNGANLTQEEKKSLVYEKLIKIVPKVGVKDTSNSVVVVRVASGRTNSENSEFRNVDIVVEVFVPLTQWIIKDSNLRPFAILGQIQKSLNDKTINGLGKMRGGDFELSYLTEELSCYVQEYRLVSYD